MKTKLLERVVEMLLENALLNYSPTHPPKLSFSMCMTFCS